MTPASLARAALRADRDKAYTEGFADGERNMAGDIATLRANLRQAVVYFNDNGGPAEYSWLSDMQEALACAHRYGRADYCLDCHAKRAG